jgi:hypothetical protein
METVMAKVFAFPQKDDWSGAEKLIAKKMKQEGFGDDAIRTVNERVRSYRDNYVMVAPFNIDIADLGLSPEVMPTIEAVLQKVEDWLQKFTNNILIERISTEIDLLALD